MRGHFFMLHRRFCMSYIQNMCTPWHDLALSQYAKVAVKSGLAYATHTSA